MHLAFRGLIPQVLQPDAERRDPACQRVRNCWPRFGYFGVVRGMLDLDLIAELAARRPAVPLRFYECLAPGQPVVWTLEPSAFSEHIVRSVRTSEEFVAGVERFLNTKSSEHDGERVRIARENSWKNRVDIIENALETVRLSE